GDGVFLVEGLIFASDGQFYGAATYGGDFGAGVVFRMDKAGNVTPLWQLGAKEGDPAVPSSALFEAEDGRLYGTTYGGGERGTLYSLGRDGSDGRIVHSFFGRDGENPNAPVIQGSDGRLYGTARGGGRHGRGTVFSVAPDGSDFRVLHAFDRADTGL